MKITLRRNPRNGYAVVMMMALLSILLMLMLANSQNVRQLGRELNHLEDRQRSHWQQVEINTNLVQQAGGR